MKIILLLTFLILSINLWAENNLISGYIKQYNYTDISGAMSDINWTNKKLSQDNFLYDRGGLTLQLRFNNDISEDIYFNSILEFDYDFKIIEQEPTSLNSDGMTTYFKEGYIGIRDIGGFLDLKIGRQYIFWGKFEWGGALDVISPWNFMTMSAEKENYRVAVDALKLDFNITDFMAFEMIFLPIASINKMELPDNMGPLSKSKSIHPSKSVKNTEIGVKITFDIGDDTDLSLNYFKGYDRNFSIVVDMNNAIFTPEYKKLQVMGIDFETIVFDTVWLFELAYLHTEDESGKDVSIKNRNIKSAFGFEKEFSNGLSVNFQISYTRLLDYNRQLEYDTLSPMLGDDIFVSRTNTYTAIYRVRYSINPMLSFQFLGSSDLFDLNMMNLLFVSWNISSQTKSYIGIINFRGDLGTRFGRLENFSRFFMELKYAF
jgi:hypothetical protein